MANWSANVSCSKCLVTDFPKYGGIFDPVLCIPNDMIAVLRPGIANHYESGACVALETADRADDGQNI